MNGRIWFVNILLAGMLVFCGISIRNVWQKDLQRISATRAQDARELKTVSTDIEDPLLRDKAYRLIVNKNLFLPDRKVVTPETGPEEPLVQETVKISGEKIVLYGVIITGDMKTALINNPGGKLGGDKKNKWVQEGQALANLRVMAIHPEEILLSDGNQRYHVLLTKNKDRGSDRQRPRQSGPSVVSGGRSRSSSSGTEASGGGPQSEAISKDGKYKIVDTPLGKIKKRIE